MRKYCGQPVQRLGTALVQTKYNLDKIHNHVDGWTKLGRFVNIKTSALYPETAINTQLILINLPLLAAYLYTLYTGPTNTNNLNKRIVI
jgi:hypothetical protein